MLKLRGGMAAFQIEIGRWHGVKREERVCKECDCGEVENVCHWLSVCGQLGSINLSVSYLLARRLSHFHY